MAALQGESDDRAGEPGRLGQSGEGKIVERGGGGAEFVEFAGGHIGGEDAGDHRQISAKRSVRPIAERRPYLFLARHEWRERSGAMAEQIGFAVAS